MTQLSLLTEKKSINQQSKLLLRDYQKDVINQIYHHYKAGIKSVMLVSPTGSGKTLTATHIIRDAVSRGKRVLFIIHREPLVNQTVRTLHSYGVESVGYIKAGFPHANDADRVIVASIQTLARRDYPENIDLVVFDETHTTSFWKTAQKLVNYYTQSPIIQSSKVHFLHLTATPFRLKASEYFGNHIQAIVQAPHIGQLIRRGYLVAARHFGYNGLADFSKLETGHDGDYKKSQVVGVCKQLEYNKAVVYKFLEICPDRKAICFAASVEQSLLLTELFNNEGIITEHIQAETPTEIRQEIFDRLKRGDTQIISSVGTLTEGFDEPSIEAVILARPTKSLSLLIQMCGRGLRLYLDKKDCFLLVFGENFKRLGRIDTKRKITLCPRPPKEKESTKQCPQCEAYINIFSQVCPECGFVFSTGEKEDNSFVEAVFGELLNREEMDQIRYIRSQRKTRFTKGLPPDNLWELWDNKYPGKLLCNDWLYGAVFKGDNSHKAQEEFTRYLYEMCPDAKPNWVKFHLALEFNNPNFLQESKAKSSYSPPPSAAIRSWWQVLKIDPLSDFKAIQEGYRKLISICQDDELSLFRLNKAYDQGMHFRKIVINRATHGLIKKEVLDYGEIIQQINLEMKRISWTPIMGQEYIIKTYGKRSRQLLNDEQLIEFIQYLSEIDT